MQVEGNAEYLLFVCQVGHAYSASTLLVGKEARLEEVLWSGVYRLEELANLLVDLAGRGGPDGVHPEWPPAHRRIARLRDQAKRLRQVLDDNEPIDLGHGVVPERDIA